MKPPKKFDLVISNPPYNNGLDLKILKEVYPIGDRFILVHPAMWLYDNKLKNKLFKNTRELVKNHFVGYEKVENANRLFGIALFTDVFITEIDKSKEGMGNAIYDIDIHGDSEVYQSLKKKVLNYCQNVENLEKKRNQEKKEHWIGFGGIGCNLGRKDFLVIIRKSLDIHLNTKNPSYCLRFYFETGKEAENFYEYLKLKIVRFCLSIYKQNQHFQNGELLSIPYMPTYTKSWTDELVAAELNLTKEELEFALNWVPDYYPEEKIKKEGMGNAIYDIDIHGDSEIYKSIKKKVLDYCEKMNMLNMNNINVGIYNVGFCEHSPSGNLAFIGKTSKIDKHISINKKHHLNYKFSNNTEANFFYSYLKLKITRFCLSIYKMNQQLGRGELASVPYLPTYTKPWTDEEVAAELGLTEEELRWAINWVPDYYPEEKRNKEKKEFCVCFGGIRGHVGSDDFYTIVQKDKQKHINSLNPRYGLRYDFGTIQEAENFYEYLKLKLVRFCLSIYKMNQNLHRGELKSVPLMPTYTKSWTDEEVAAELGLTEEELRWAINWVPDYYPEDKIKTIKDSN